MSRPETVRIAMWSGPRNISTAMLRAWENRPDTVVCDEPLYAHYLQQTGLDHPGADEVVERHERDWHRVVAWLTGPVPGDRRVFYQKHMAHHLLPNIERPWLDGLTHAFLIRDPREMLTSLVNQLPHPTLADTGLPQQVEIFEMVRHRTGEVPAVIDARDVLLDPPAMLPRLCEALGVEFSSRMLRWPPGPRDTDGVWAPHWYAEVERSTGFRPYRPKEAALPPELEALCAECLPHYRLLHGHRLRRAND